MKPVCTKSEDVIYILISILSSTLYFVHYINWASCQVINNRDFHFPFDKENLDINISKKLVELGKKIQIDYQKNSHKVETSYSKKGRFFLMTKQHFI